MPKKITEQTIATFCVKRWGYKNHARIIQKLCEEVGEVAGATLKIEEGRATREDLQAEIGDVLIVLSQLACMEGTTLEKLRADRFKAIVERHSIIPSPPPSAPRRTGGRRCER